MKKFISLFLAVVMTVTCFSGVFSASAADEGSKLDDFIGDMTNMESFQNAILGGNLGFDFSEEDQLDINNMINNSQINAEMFGISINDLYSGKAVINWNNFPINKGDLALAIANVNSYLVRIFKEKFGNGKILSMEMSRHGTSYASYYATSIANFLGNLFYPDFKEVKIEFEGTQLEVSEEDFYAEIVRQSGFGLLIDTNWCEKAKVDFRPFMETFGLTSDKILQSEYTNGYILGRKLVKSTVEKFIYDGPLTTALSIIDAFSKAYKTHLKGTVEALFANRLSAGEIRLSDLDSLHGLFNIVFNGNNPDAADKLQFVQMPVASFVRSESSTELFLYIMMYSAINVNYKNNRAVAEDMKIKVDSLDVTDEDKNIFKCMVDAVFKGDINGLASNIESIFSANIEKIPDDFLSAVKNAIVSFFKKVAAYIENLMKFFSGEAEPPRWDIEDR